MVVSIIAIYAKNPFKRKKKLNYFSKKPRKPGSTRGLNYQTKDMKYKYS